MVNHHCPMVSLWFSYGFLWKPLYIDSLIWQRDGVVEGAQRAQRLPLRRPRDANPWPNHHLLGRGGAPPQPGDL